MLGNDLLLTSWSRTNQTRFILDQKRREYEKEVETDGVEEAGGGGELNEKTWKRRRKED